MLRRIARFSASLTPIVFVLLACSHEVIVAETSEAGPPSFAAPDADVPEEAGLTSYCPTNKCPPGWTTCPNSRFPCDVNLLTDPSNCGACGRACPPGSWRETFACVDGACVPQCKLESSRLDCDGLADNGCETYKRNNNHCGACGNECSDPAKQCADQTGDGEHFDCGCPADRLYCYGRCVDSKNDDVNCGGCFKFCDPTGGGAPELANAYYGCGNGECGTLKCKARFADCDGLTKNGCETHLVSDANCGACGNACPDGQACRVNDESGQIQCMCPPGLTYCEAGCSGDECKGVCVDLTSNPSHCGACGARCPSNVLSDDHRHICSYGTCTMRCGDGYADCNNSESDGCEVNTNSDPRNCGSCGNACDAVAGQACVAGRCVVEPCDSEGTGATAR
jgi:hypothetical protein